MEQMPRGGESREKDSEALSDDSFPALPLIHGEVGSPCP